jgi:Ca2+-binding EF-hand superfamily protein
MREAAHQVVDEVFRLADTDRSGSLTQGEALQAGWSRVRALASGAFLTYDGNGDKKLSLDEFQSALKESSRVAFQAADTDKDGALTANEVGSAVRGIARRVWLPAADAVKAADAQDSRNP